jgi:hypothetical protein
MSNLFALVLEGGGGVKFMKCFQGGALYKSLGTFGLQDSQFQN